MRTALRDARMPLTLWVDDSAGVEFHLHSIFGKNRISGEWFSISLEQIREALQALGLNP